MPNLSNFLSGIKTVNGVQLSCPKCKGFKISSRNDTTNNLIAGGLILAPFFGIGLLLLPVALVYHLVTKPFYLCKNCGYKWSTEKKTSNALDK